MNYNDTLAYIKSLGKFGSRPGLERISELCAALGNPQEKLKFIHVAGTNGKGSTCQFIASILTEMGHRIGVYSSPAIRDYREYIQICGQGNISEQYFVRIAEQIINTGVFVTEFEFTTAMSFLVFAEKACDYVIIETGMGGLLDSTNVIPSPKLAVITPISIDHAEVLGSTIKEITAQKCGIIKDAPCVSILQPFMPENTILAPTPKIIETSLKGTHFSEGLESNKYFIPLLGIHQPTNASIAITAVKTLFPEITTATINRGLSRAYLPCRFEIVQENPYVIYDGAHNPAGAKALADSLKTYFPNKRITFIMGMLADKDYESCVRILSPIATRFIAVTPDSPRALPSETLDEIACKYCNRQRESETGEDEIFCVCGSFKLFKENIDTLKSLW